MTAQDTPAQIIIEPPDSNVFTKCETCDRVARVGELADLMETGVGLVAGDPVPAGRCKRVTAVPLSGAGRETTETCPGLAYIHLRTQAEYVEDQGDCPRCGFALDDGWENIEVEGREAWQRAYCGRCGLRFSARYQLVGYEAD